MVFQVYFGFIQVLIIMLPVFAIVVASLLRAGHGQTIGYTPSPTVPYGIKTINVGGFGTASAISDLASV